MTTPWRTIPIAFTAIGILALTAGCAGSIGASASGEAGEGFEYGAIQDEVNEVIADLDPVTLVYQPASSSPDDTGAPSALAYKEAIEERSNGQIEVEIVYGQAIASYTEVIDALSDGRVDIAHTVPAYLPSEFPAYNELMSFSQLAPTSPLVGEMATNAMLSQLAWENDAVLQEFEDKGLVPLTPQVNSGDFFFVCNPQNAENSTADDWQSRQIRIGTQDSEAAVRDMGANPVSLEYVEAFEALQRNTIDCTMTQLGSAAVFGVTTVAPNISYLTEGSFAGRAAAAHLGGTGFSNLPLAYQQIVFDAQPDYFALWNQHLADSNVMAVEQANENGGTITALPDEVQNTIRDSQAGAIVDTGDSETITQAIASDPEAIGESWMSVADEMGYADGGDLQSIGDWYSPDDYDFLPYATKIYEDVFLPHRPE
ncbi:TRAP transporter substrate-binding protein DctP [Brevibacterium yomogidense]|uniref:TRAP transporter substrate-binding protein DctP n=1 Tax=Brevibacterium yomogidense TaxID=946573 RepID=UPI0018DFF049|nr:TRAP transporter substrate-binding protein DctP [Brevibacterium yomogidense]